MIDPTSIDYAQVAKVAKDGSPMLLHAIGRLYGIGPSERAAFGADGMGVPGWAWGTLVFVAGVTVGIRAYRKWPNTVPKIISGRR